MEIMTGSRREITIFQWKEILEKYMKRANDSMECFRRFEEASDLEHLISQERWRNSGRVLPNEGSLPAASRPRSLF